MSRELQITPLSTVSTYRQRWACSNQVPMGTLTMIAGIAGIAKSTIAGYFIAGWTLGTLDGDLKGQPAVVAMINGEDDMGTVLIPRLQAAGADLERIVSLSSVRVMGDDGTSWLTSPTFADDLQAIRQAIVGTGAKILIIDPVISLMKGDSHRLDDVRRNLDPLAGLASELDIAIVCVAHFNKGQGRAGDRVSGSHGFRDITRSLMVLAVDEETDNRILTVEKSNYSAEKPSVAFAVESVRVPTSDGDFTVVGRANYLGVSSLTVEDILTREDSNLASLTKRLLAFVAQHPEGVNAKDVADHLECTEDKARTYLNRQAKAGRITRADRGVFTPVNTEQHNVPTVLSVSNVLKNSTLITLSTPDTDVLNEICIHGQTVGLRCTRCGGSAVAA